MAERKLTLTNMVCNQTINVKFKDLSYAVQVGCDKPKKPILNGLSGIFRSTKLTAIMGPSGAGKTTLLNILSSFQKDLYTGTVEYLSSGDKQRSFKKHQCYIQQTDNLHVFFTIHEIMTITSYLKINRNISSESRQFLIDDILNILKLSSARKTRVSQLSGGQKKKLSIALELIDNPPLMFLDEPTSGLDAVASIQCATVLKSLARAGRTVVCTIHQPSAALYQMFDHIYLIVNGHCMYRSTPGDTVNYFARQGIQCPKYYNPADYMMEVVSKEYGNYDEQLIAAAKLAESNDEARLIKSSREIIPNTFDKNPVMIETNPPTELMRFWVLLQRCMILAYRDGTTIHFSLVVHIFLALIVGLFYIQIGDEGSKQLSNITYLLNSVLYFYYTSIMPTVLRIPLEIDILRKESFNNWYQLRTYFIALLVYRIPIMIIFSFIYTIITYLISSQLFEFSRFFMFFFMGCLTNLLAESMGLIYGAFFNPVNGTFVGTIIGSLMFLLSGVLIRFRDMTKFIYFISYLNVIRYVLDGFVQSIYSNREKLHCSTNYCHLRVPSMILKEFDMDKPMFWYDVTIVLGHIVFYYFIAYILLKKRLSRIY